MIHWYTCIEFVIITCFATLVFMVWWACRSEEVDLWEEARKINAAYKEGYADGSDHDNCVGCGDCLDRGVKEWVATNGFQVLSLNGQSWIDYQGRRYYEKPF